MPATSVFYHDDENGRIGRVVKFWSNLAIREQIVLTGHIGDGSFREHV